jgi:hypothetical protein
MNLTALSRRWGGCGADPSEEEMRSALAELDAPDPEHPDCWLSDQHGWCISAFGSGLVILENAESDEGPWHMRGQTKEMVLALWKSLQAGDMAAIHNQKWIEGYGVTSESA